MNEKRILITWGGVGDVIMCTPAISALKKKYPDQKIILYCLTKAHMDVFKNNPDISSLRLFRISSMWRYPYHLFARIFNPKLVNFTFTHFQHIPPSFIYRKSIKEIAADMFEVKLDSPKVTLYLTDTEEKKALKLLHQHKNTIILHIHSRASKNHHWKVSNWIELVKSLPQFTFIQLGLKDEDYVEGAVDLRGKTSLREAMALIKNADSFVGVDSSFSHVTNAFKTRGVVLFGDSDPVLWGHDNNINIYKNIECSPCFYFLQGHNCPYDNECMNLIGVDEVKKALLLQMNKNMVNNEVAALASEAILS